jgi:hypothetical protein
MVYEETVAARKLVAVFGLDRGVEELTGEVGSRQFEGVCNITLVLLDIRSLGGMTSDMRLHPDIPRLPNERVRGLAGVCVEGRSGIAASVVVM